MKTFVATLLALFAAACGDPDAQQLQKEVSEAWSAFEAYTAEKGQDFVQAMEPEVQRMRSELGRLSEDARKRLQPQLDELARKREELAQKLEDAQQQAAEDWPKMKEEILDEARELDQSIQEALSKLTGS